jgi:hypothetical protein
MAAMEGLGRLFNVIPVASGVHVKLNAAEAVTFVIYEVSGATVIGLKESIAGASEQNLTRTRRITSNGVGTAQVWTERTQTASATITKADTTAENCTLITVTAPELSTGFDSVECTVDGAALCVAILHDLSVQSAPNRLPAPAN